MISLFRKAKKEKNTQIKEYNREYPSQINVRCQPQHKAIVKDYQTLKRMGLVDFTVASLFRDFITTTLKDKLEAIIIREEILETNHDWENHPKYNQ